MKATVKTDWLSRVLALNPYFILYRAPSTPTQDEIKREVARLDALPKSDQLLIFCDAMGFRVCDYLSEKAKFNSEVEAEIEWLTLEHSE